MGDADHSDVEATVKAEIAKGYPDLSCENAWTTFESSDAVNSTKTNTISIYTGEGKISVKSKDTKKVGVSISGNTITVTRRSADTGVVFVTVAASEGQNYKARERGFNVELK